MKSVYSNKKYYFLDFDGVIVNSNNFKKKMIEKAVFLELGEKKSKIFADYFDSLNGISREIKIRSFFNDNYLSNKILSKYNDLVKSKYNDCSLTHNAHIFLAYLNKNDIFPYILSGGKKKEIKSYLKQNLTEIIFKDIFDDSKSKKEWFETILKENCLPQDLIFIGDSIVDYEAAKEFNIDFIFMQEYASDESLYKKIKNIKVIKNLQELIE